MSLNLNSQPATKADLKNLATKADIKDFVTKKGLKEELKKFATKADIKDFVTKKDLKKELKNLATKKELTEGFGKIGKQLSTIINFFDHLTIDHEKRIKRLEHHADLTPLN